MIAVSAVLEYADIHQRLSVPDHVLDFGFFLRCGQHAVLGLANADGVGFENGGLIGDDKDCFLRQLEDAFDAAQRQRDVRLPRCLVVHVSGQSAGTPCHHVGIQRLCDKKAMTKSTASGASLVSDIMDAVYRESVAVERGTDLLAFHGSFQRFPGAAVTLLLAVIGEVFAEQFLADRILNGRIVRIIVIRHFYGNQRRLTVDVARADVIGHVRIGNIMTVAHEPSAIFLEFLDGEIKTHTDHSAGAVVHEIRDTDFFCVFFVYRRQLLGFETLVQHAFKARGIQFAVL